MVSAFAVCESLGRPGRKMKKSSAIMENIPYNMVLHKHVDGAYTRFSTMEGPLANNPFAKMAWSAQKRDLPSSF